MALPLLNLTAVPFTYGDNSLAARRQTRRNGGGCCQAQQATRPLGTSPSANQIPFEMLDHEKRSIIAFIVNEAAKEIQSVIGLAPAQRDTETTLTQPPNSPQDQNTFEFPEVRVNRQDGLPSAPVSRKPVIVRQPAAASSTEEEDCSSETPARPRRTRSFRKRRRIPSFKTGANPRVPAKLGCSSSEADDEESDLDSNPQPRLDDCERSTELQLKLNLVSESRKSLQQDKTEWAKVGTELRLIADSFSRGLDSDEATENGSIDIFAIINTMLPISVPQSLWSALVSYAAWKIFKRFQ